MVDVDSKVHGHLSEIFQRNVRGISVFGHRLFQSQ